jgi:hypothetical protein
MVPKTRGMMRTSKGRNVGRHTVMTPTVSSRKEKVAASTLSQVGSVATAAAPSVRMR